MLASGKRFVWKTVDLVPILRIVVRTRRTRTPKILMSLMAFWLRRRKAVYWSANRASVVVDARNIVAGIETSPGLMPGRYIQGSNGIFVGDFTPIAANIVMVRANRAQSDNRAHLAPPPIRIGAYCWICANAVILPGVTLGEYSVVGAGAIVMKSVPSGYCVLVGNPAAIVRPLDPEAGFRHYSPREYDGFIPHGQFKQFRRRRLTK